MSAQEGAPGRATATQLPLPLPHRASRDGDDFLVAPCNAPAVRWIDRWPDWPGPCLALAGPRGCGKSHLAAVWAQASGARDLDRTALTDEAAPPGGDGACLILDDAECLMGDRQAETALFHLFNRLHGKAGRLLLTGHAPPARWPVVLPDLRSRLGAVPVAEIGPPDDGLMAALLVKLFADRQIAVGTETIGFLTARMERSFAAAAALVEAADRRALAGGRAVTIPLLREVLAELGERRAP